MGFEIQGNLTFSAGTTARPIEAWRASMLQKVHVLTNGVGGGRFPRVEAKLEGKGTVDSSQGTASHEA